MRQFVLGRGVVLFASVSLLLGGSLPSRAAVTVDLALNGIGYTDPTLLGNAFTLNVLNTMIQVYNGGTSQTIGGEVYTIDKGSSTPTAPPLPLAPSLGLHGQGNGTPSAIIDLGAGGYTYIEAQWGGPTGANAIYYIKGLSGLINLVNDLPGTFNDQNSHSHPRTQLGLSGYYYLAVPEPTTIVAGALLLAPFGASALRLVRKSPKKGA